MNGCTKLSRTAESRSAAAFDTGAETWRFVLSKGVTRVSFKPIRTYWRERQALPHRKILGKTNDWLKLYSVPRLVPSR